MRNKMNFNPKFDYLIPMPRIQVDDDILMSLEFEQIELEYRTEQIDYKEMQKQSSIEVRVFNELFLDKEIEFLDLLDLDISYPLYL